MDTALLIGARRSPERASFKASRTHDFHFKTEEVLS